MKTIARLLIFAVLLTVMVKVLDKNTDQTNSSKDTIAQAKQ
ncbi:MULTISPECIES: hypothetical protein [unclassified Olleya]|nr:MULTISPECIES: hypothetical protein [unclassified Olleya]